MMLQLTIVLSTTNDGVNVEPLAIVVDNDAVVESIVVRTIVIQMALIE